MPYCINYPKRTYTGKEHSPKGLGYCASGELVQLGAGGFTSA